MFAHHSRLNYVAAAAAVALFTMPLAAATTPIPPDTTVLPPFLSFHLSKLQADTVDANASKVVDACDWFNQVGQKDAPHLKVAMYSGEMATVRTHIFLPPLPHPFLFSLVPLRLQ